MSFSLPHSPAASPKPLLLGADKIHDQADLEVALAHFQAILTDEERRKLHSQRNGWKDADAAFKFTLELDELDHVKSGKTIASKVCSLLQTVQGFSQVVNTYVSSNPQIAALIWGSLKLTYSVRQVPALVLIYNF